MLRFIHKHKSMNIEAPAINVVEEKPSVVEKTASKGKKNKKQELKEDMDFETIKALEAELAPEEKVKKIKTDRGLIERAESSKTIITENNQQLLLG